MRWIYDSSNSNADIVTLGNHCRQCRLITIPGAVRQIKIRITLLTKPKSMRSIVDATRREQRHGSAWNWCVNRGRAPMPHTLNLTPHPAPVAPLADQSGGEWWTVLGVNQRIYNLRDKWCMLVALIRPFDFSNIITTRLPPSKSIRKLNLYLGVPPAKRTDPIRSSTIIRVPYRPTQRLVPAWYCRLWSVVVLQGLPFVRGLFGCWKGCLCNLKRTWLTVCEQWEPDDGYLECCCDWGLSNIGRC